MDGRQHFELVKKAIREPYAEAVRGESYVRNGRVYERLLEKIVRAAFPKADVIHPRPLIPVEREGGKGGYLQPDLKVGDSTFIEVTTWADSNMVFSKLMQGCLVKKRFPDARYFVVVADLGLAEGWSYDDERLWDEWGRVGEVRAVDGWYGFANIGDLVSAITNGL